MKIILTNHFLKRWRERIGSETEHKIKNLIVGAIKTHSLRAVDKEAFEVPVGGIGRAILKLYPQGYIAKTVKKKHKKVLLMRIFTIGIIYPNGSSSGAWGYEVYSPDKQKTQLGVVGYTTEARINLISVIKALEVLDYPTEVEILTNSSDIIKTVLLGNLDVWRNNNYRYRSKKQVPNRDLWCCLDDLLFVHQVGFNRPVSDEDQEIMKDLKRKVEQYASVILNRCKGLI